MPQSNLKEHLSAYRQWRMRTASAVKDLDEWLKDNHRASDETRACIQTAQAAAESMDLGVAFLSGTGVDKSALIDALFLQDEKRSIRPTYSGNDTCATELCWDSENGEAYLRLLPIETLDQDRSLAELRSDLTLWVHRPLDSKDPEQTAIRLREITQTKMVAAPEAQHLGLAPIATTAGDSGPVEIPRWRHAIISFPSPILRLGLRLLDVPPLAPPQRLAKEASRYTSRCFSEPGCG